MPNVVDPFRRITGHDGGDAFDLMPKMESV
jgi:hypothetical protein